MLTGPPPLRPIKQRLIRGSPGQAGGGYDGGEDGETLGMGLWRAAFFPKARFDYKRDCEAFCGAGKK